MEPLPLGAVRSAGANSVISGTIVMTANDLKLIFAARLIRLRRDAGMTQAELGEKLNYSDKTVSKWERGEAIPDAFVLKQLSAIFSVSVDSLLEEEPSFSASDIPDTVSYHPKYIALTSVAGIFTLCLLEFVLVWMIVDKFHWSVLFAALPLSLIALLVMNSLWAHGKNNSFLIGALVASLILLAYLIAFQFRCNLWQLLLVILPAEVTVFLACRIRAWGHRIRKKRQSRGRGSGLYES